MTVAVQEIEAMPSDVQREVLDFAQFLMSKKQPEREGKAVRQGWAGVLREFKGRFSALELQKKAQEWRV